MLALWQTGDPSNDVPHLSPRDSWDRLQLHRELDLDKQLKKWMDGWQKTENNSTDRIKKKRPIIKTLSGAVKRRFKTVDIYGGSL